VNRAAVRKNPGLPHQILLLVMAGNAGVANGYSKFGASTTKAMDEAAEQVGIISAMPAGGSKRFDSAFPFPPT